MATAKQVVDIATAEIGYHEKASNSNLDSKTGNNGSANWTKYARDLANAGYYNGSKNGFEWCDVFADWCFWMACGKDPAKAQALQCQTGPLGAACPYSAGYYKNQGRYDKNPKVGDQVFFQQNGSLVHTGIVVGVTSSQVTTVEGNASNQVMKKTYSRSSSYIGGYGHPKYDSVSSGWVKENGEYKFKNPATGQFVSNMWVGTSKGLWYYIGVDGIMCHGGLTFVPACKGINENGADQGTFTAGWFYLQPDNENGCIGSMKSGEQVIVKSTTEKVPGANVAVFETKHNGHFGACMSVNGKAMDTYTELPA